MHGGEAIRKNSKTFLLQNKSNIHFKKHKRLASISYYYMRIQMVDSNLCSMQALS